jgi:hypothetical protein
MPEIDPAPKSALSRSTPILPWALVAAAIAGGAALWLWRSRAEPPAAPRAAEPPPAAAPASAEATPPPAEAAPPAPADARALLEAVSPSPLWRTWLAGGEAVERWSAAIENVATGASPRAHLLPLELRGKFQVEARGGRTVIAPASYARYDEIADAIAALDAGAVARAWRALHSTLDAAYAALGYPRGALDAAAAKALRRIASTPVPEGEVAVVDEGGIWLYEDPALERRAEVEKHLLRMGPRNERLVQAKARELLDALGLSTFPAKAP